jgi:hypothetical protein
MKHRRLFIALVVASSSAHAQWRYDFNDDSMTGKREETASIESINSLDLGFPYKGRNMATLTVRKSPRRGTHVYFQIEKGQFVCGVSDCEVLVRFDEQQPTRYRAVGPADHSSKVLFLEPEGRFIAAARKAKTIRVQANIYQSGAPVLEFNAGALEWPPVWTRPAASAVRK